MLEEIHNGLLCNVNKFRAGNPRSPSNPFFHLLHFFYPSSMLPTHTYTYIHTLVTYTSYA